MMNINLVVVGKIKEDYLDNAISEYIKRIKPFCNLKITEIKEFNTPDTNKNLNMEADLILDSIKDDYVVTLEIEGKEFDSVEFSNFIEKHYSYSDKPLTFIIGSSCGLASKLKERSNYKLSFSKMTFPHQLMRVIFLEQLYRALTIINNIKYHK